MQDYVDAVVEDRVKAKKISLNNSTLSKILSFIKSRDVKGSNFSHELDQSLKDSLLKRDKWQIFKSLGVGNAYEAIEQQQQEPGDILDESDRERWGLLAAKTAFYLGAVPRLAGGIGSVLATLAPAVVRRSFAVDSHDMWVDPYGSYAMSPTEEQV